jgi:hypothetical protein
VTGNIKKAARDAVIETGTVSIPTVTQISTHDIFKETMDW